MTTTIDQPNSATATSPAYGNDLYSFVRLVGPLAGASCAVALGLLGTAYLSLIAVLDSSRLAAGGAVFGVLYFVCAVVAFAKAVNTARVAL